MIMRILIILLILTFNNVIKSQDYFFEFVDGWVNNHCVELDDSYLFMGLGLIGSSQQHQYLYNELGANGTLLNQITYDIDSLSTTSTMLNSQMAIELSEDNILIAGVFGQNIMEGELFGSLIGYNAVENTFDVIMSLNIDSGTQFFNVANPNDTTLLVAGLWGNGTYIHTRVWNFNLAGEERWSIDFLDCDYCFLTPIQILPLSNGNIAYLYREFKDNFAYTDRERAILVMMDGMTGEQIGDEILIGDHENYRIWAGGMVEQDGNILVSYTQPYYYDEDGEWHFNHSNSIHLDRILLTGEVLWSISYLESIPNGIEEIGRYQYKVNQMQKLTDGNLLISGTTGYGGLMMKVNEDGELIWFNELFPHDFDDNTSQVWYTHILYATPTSDGGYLCAGQYYSDPGVLYPSGIQTAIAIKVDEYGCLEEDCQVGVDENVKQSLAVYPNPSNGEFNITFPQNEVSELEVYDALGKLIFNENDIRESNYILNLSSFEDGIYYIHIQSETGGRYFSKIVKR